MATVEDATAALALPPHPRGLYKQIKPATVPVPRDAPEVAATEPSGMSSIYGFNIWVQFYEFNFMVQYLGSIL